MRQQNKSTLNLLPCPRSLKRLVGNFVLPKIKPLSSIKIVRTDSAPDHPEGYLLTISKLGIEISYREIGGLHAASATLRQIIREHGRRLPCVKIRDWPDFRRRGVMLDISRGRVPKLETLLQLVEHLADFKINELQLYTEHTFAYRKYKSVWRSWGALTGREIRKLDARCRELGIDLVPNQNSFGHLRYLFDHPKLKKLAELTEPYEDAGGEFVRRPTTLAPNDPETLPFLRGLYDELLPNFSSQLFNVGCDETWDLGRGKSKALCARIGKGSVYLEFLKKIHREVSKRGKRLMFWGDIILKHPNLIAKLPRNLIALNWGYEANHPFERESAKFAKSRIPFYVCPGTSTWQTLIGRHDNALANLRSAARTGKKFSALGYLICDWGDGGHPQPLAVSYIPYAAGASLAWNSKRFDESFLIPVLSRDVYSDPTNRLAKAAFDLGVAHLKLGVKAPNETPLGTVIAAPPLEERELFCRNGLKWFNRIHAKSISATMSEIAKQRKILSQSKPNSAEGKLSKLELDLAAKMAEQSCKFMLWQKASAARREKSSKRLAAQGIRELKTLDRQFNSYWQLRNKATPRHCSQFLKWRIADYQRGHVK